MIKLMSEPFDGLSIARARIAEEAKARTGFLDLGGLGLAALPEELFQLRHLRELNLGAGIRREDGTWRESYSIEDDTIPRNEVLEQLSRLQQLSELRRLSLANLAIANLASVANLVELQMLDCGGTQVVDLAPLKSLTELQSLECNGMQLVDLTPLANLTSLRSIICGDTSIVDLSALSDLAGLQSLDCRRTKVTDLTPIASLAALQSLDCSGTQVADLTPLAGLAALQSLSCSGTEVTDLTPITGLAALQSLDCSGTQVTDLTPLADLAALQWLDCSDCSLQALPEPVRNIASLQQLHLFKTTITGMPAEALSQRYDDNCLAAVRAHFRDLADGGTAATDVKLIVLGNGRVGKTQICRRLRNEIYDGSEPSTHGVLVTSASLETDGATTRLNIWDFGGQDLYHGTHALFLRTSAIFMLVWARETENAQTHEYQGVTFRNQPLTYWLAYVRHLSGIASPVLIVQTRCDRPQDEALSPPVSDADMAGFEHRSVLQYSAFNNRKRETLDGTLREAVASLRERFGVAQVGIGRMQVQRELQKMRDADAAVPSNQRQYRTITQAHFRSLSEAAGNVSSPEELLRFLHNAGILFYRRGLFEDRIVLDQGWALDAIYAVFNRDKCWQELRRLRGRFTRPLLELLVWGDHSAAEQKLFLDMMRSCGICFVHRQGPRDEDETTEYIAPDLLPERNAVQDELDAMWDAARPTESAEFEFEMLHPGLARGLICEVGNAAGIAALYWRGGACAYETTTRSHALIEQHAMQDAWHGHISVHTQGGQAKQLLDRLADWIERRSGHGGLRAARLGGAALPIGGAEAVERESGKSRSDSPPGSRSDSPPGVFGAPPVAKPEYFVSYAWGDDKTPEGLEREKIVDQLCADAKTRGVQVIRDKNTLRIGDRITPFMQRVGAGDRVFVIVSGKYLRSPFCMFELLEIWRYSRGNEADFRRRVAIYALPDANARTPIERIRLARDWKRDHDEIAELIKENGGEILGTQDFQRFKLMADFYRHVPDILATMFDTVQPRSFEELAEHGFDGSPRI